MSKMTATSVWAPPAFPLTGRLPDSIDQVQANVDLQYREEKEYHLQLNAEMDRNNPKPCCKSLHISLFFDGTNNNEKHSTAANPPNPSNIARLYHAALEDIDSGYYRYYMPGVGTAFPEIGELDFSDDGLRFATGGEARINWALLRIVDALSHSLVGTRIEDGVAKTLINDYQRLASRLGADPNYMKRRRQDIFITLLTPLLAAAKIHKPKILKIKLFVYGFSRGAAEARTFVNWLTHILDAELLKKKTARPELLGLPIAVEFLGLCDTVASVGLAHVAPMANGHMGWADATMALPDEAKYPGFIQRCYHFVSAHEQRLCFPLDSVRRTQGNYPARTYEVIYPGVHSDVGGGYAPGEQGKALQDSELLSQIVLHDIYAVAFAAGGPLMVPSEMIPPYLVKRKPSRIMTPLSKAEFDFSPKLIQRFNAWRTTLAPFLNGREDKVYTPVIIGDSLEKAIENQMAWMTAWRIGRFANGSYQWQPFYIEARENSRDVDPKIRIDSEEERNKKQKAAEDARKAKNGNPNTPGVPIFEPALDQQQLMEGANEFRQDYESISPLTVGMSRENTGGVIQVFIDDVAGPIIYILNTDDQTAEYTQMKDAGNKLKTKLFKNVVGGITDDPQQALVCDLYDNQIHDSRAWFMQSTMGMREMWAGYFRYRMIYSGDYANKETSIFLIPKKHGEVIIGTALYKTVQVGKALDKVTDAVKSLPDKAKKGVDNAINNATEAAAKAVKEAAKETIRGVFDGLGKKISPTIPGLTSYNMSVSPDCQVVNVQGQVLYPQPIITEVCAPTHNLAELHQQYEQLELTRHNQKMEGLLAALNSPSSAEEIA